MKNHVNRKAVSVNKFARFKRIVLEQAELNKIRKNRQVNRALENLVSVLDMTN